jgi:hypothetical protein
MVKISIYDKTTRFYVGTLEVSRGEVSKIEKDFIVSRVACPVIGIVTIDE